MSTKELRYPLKCEGRTYEVVEDRGQVHAVGSDEREPYRLKPIAYRAIT